MYSIADGSLEIRSGEKELIRNRRRRLLMGIHGSEAADSGQKFSYLFRWLAFPSGEDEIYCT
jgi:hypothetical protein